MKILSWQQAHWSKYLCAFNLVIRFWPGKLGTKPNALTCHLDLYLKEGGKNYGNVNPHNCRPVFSSEQLLASLWAASLLPTVLHGLVSLDVEELNKDILLALNTDPVAQSYFSDPDNPKYAQWSKDSAGFVRIDQQIYVPDSKHLLLRVLQYYHDHPVSGHLGINKTQALIHRDYTWPFICTFVDDYVRTCTTCA